ncbi:anti-FecI sigma factor FecR [Sphingopyxis fribergensis]|uniref:Anti-FecI sigma factor FecR n=1 Tax=Sphingopyxis fribergensis TaxID=1515612 RepID=A0A0A7PMH6_9SPHN|nr:FecR domain-containing protein [Sphingopyxis fribergensis]AJA11200.1 anti-FecI sigma factor FecR [Sphingopyxis fribergensis]
MTQSARKSVDEMAAEWVARMDTGIWSNADDEQLGKWLREDEQHEGALVHAQALWTVIALDRSELQDEPRGSARRFDRRKFLLGTGGALAASVVGSLYLFNSDMGYATDVGETRRVALTDGSIAAINTDSKLDVKIVENERRIKIEKGEAWFQVTKDPQRPFIVEAGEVRVRAVGTAFSVRRRGDGAEILVSEGVVEAWAVGTRTKSVRLPAGSKIRIRNNGSVDGRSSEEQVIERALAWRSGKIDLAGTRVDAAIAEMNRYNRRQIVLGDPILAAERIDGVFQTNDPEGFARVIAGSFSRSVDIANSNEIRILPH